MTAAQDMFVIDPLTKLEVMRRIPAPIDSWKFLALQTGVFLLLAMFEYKPKRPNERTDFLTLPPTFPCPTEKSS